MHPPSAIGEGVEHLLSLPAKGDEAIVAEDREMVANGGFVLCAGEELEPGVEKIAIFATPDGFPTHAARQRASGRWTSKLGELEDIEHGLHDLVGAEYGAVVLLMGRSIQE